MKRRRKKSRFSDRGASLIELIVTVLISSVVLLAVVGFLETGLQHYRKVNSETMLQMESQVTELFITELFQEASDFRIIDSAQYPEGITYAVEVQRDGKVCILALTEDELWFSEVTAGETDSGKLSGLKTQNREGRPQAFLAKYVNKFELKTDSFARAISDCNGLVGVDVIFKIEEKEYYSNSLISLRNTKKN